MLRAKFIQMFFSHPQKRNERENESEKRNVVDSRSQPQERGEEEQRFLFYCIKSVSMEKRKS